MAAAVYPQRQATSVQGRARLVCEEAAREPLLRASNADMVTASCEQQRSELVTLDRWARRSIYQDERQL